MNNSFYQQFEAELEAELTNLFNQISAKKHHIMGLLTDYFAEEDELNDFVTQYNFRLHAVERTRAALYRMLERLRRVQIKSRSEKDSHGEPEFWGNWENTQPPIAIPTTESPLRGEISEQRDAIPLTEVSTEQEDEGVNVNLLFGSEEETLDKQTASDNTTDPITNPKRMTAEPFRWMYHPRNQEMSSTFFYTRARMLSELVNNNRFDEVDILMRMPFTPEDENLWRAPLSHGGERTGERLLRFRLWDKLLDMALHRAEALATTSPHELYPEFKEWKQSGQILRLYLEDLEARKQREIEDLRRSLQELEQQSDHD